MRCNHPAGLQIRTEVLDGVTVICAKGERDLGGKEREIYVIKLVNVSSYTWCRCDFSFLIWNSCERHVCESTHRLRYMCMRERYGAPMKNPVKQRGRWVQCLHRRRQTIKTHLGGSYIFPPCRPLHAYIKHPTLEYTQFYYLLLLHRTHGAIASARSLVRRIYSFTWQ